MRLVRWFIGHPFVAGVVVALAAVLALPGSWVAQYGVRRTVVEDGAVLAVGYIAPAFSRQWSIAAAPYAEAAPAPAAPVVRKSKPAAPAAPNRRRNRS